MSIREDMLAMMLDGGGGEYSELTVTKNGIYRAADFEDVEAWNVVRVNIIPYVDGSGNIIVPFLEPKAVEGVDYGIQSRTDFRVAENPLSSSTKAVLCTLHSKTSKGDYTVDDYLLFTSEYSLSGNFSIFFTSDVDDERVVRWCKDKWGENLYEQILQKYVDGGGYFGIALTSLQGYNRYGDRTNQYKGFIIWTAKYPEEYAGDKFNADIGNYVEIIKE